MKTNDRLKASIEGVMQIVEGMRRKRWSDGKMRLVDTPEWCEFYVAWYVAKRANKPKASARRHNDGTQRPGSTDGSLATESRKPGSLK